MFPDGELTRLGTRKADLQRQITSRRSECVVAAARAVRLLVWLDGVVAFGRRLSPWASLAMIPVALSAGRAGAPRRTGVATVLRWLPVLVGAGRGIRALTSRKPSG